MRFVLIAIALAALAPTAGAQNVYRCTDAHGRIIYTDDPTAGNCTAQRLEVPPQPAAPQAGLSDAEKKLLEQANRRAAQLDRATADIVTAFNALRAAEARREQGSNPWRANALAAASAPSTGSVSRHSSVMSRMRERGSMMRLIGATHCAEYAATAAPA